MNLLLNQLDFSCRSAGMFLFFESSKDTLSDLAIKLMPCTPKTLESYWSFIANATPCTPDPSQPLALFILKSKS